MSSNKQLSSLGILDAYGQEETDDNEESVEDEKHASPSGSPPKASPLPVETSPSFMDFTTSNDDIRKLSEEQPNTFAENETTAKKPKLEEEDSEMLDTADLAQKLRAKAAEQAKRRRTISEERLTQESASWLARSVSSLSEGEITLPAEPVERCSATFQERIRKQLAFYARGRGEGGDAPLGPTDSYNRTLSKRRDFRNPSIYEKLIELVGVDEKGTNYPPEMFNPFVFGAESMYDQLANHQRLEMERIEKERQRKERSKVEIVTATVPRKQTPLAAPPAITSHSHPK